MTYFHDNFSQSLSNILDGKQFYPIKNANMKLYRPIKAQSMETEPIKMKCHETAWI